MSGTYFLSPQGNDQWSGKSPVKKRVGSEGPWQTLSGAIHRLREIRQKSRADSMAPVQLVLQDGIYPVLETLELGPEDSFLTISAAEGSAPVLEGGKVLNGWQVTEWKGRPAWILDLPQCRTGGEWTFRSLFVNGERRYRARRPKFRPERGGVDQVFRIGGIPQPEDRRLVAGDHLFRAAAGDVEDWPSLGRSEFVVLHYWTEARLPQPRFDPATGWVRFSRRTVLNLFESSGDTLARYYIDNLFEALEEPGEWYLHEGEGRLYYLPMPGETPGNTRVVAPVIDQFIRVRGRSFNENGDPVDPYHVSPVREFHLRGLTFRHSDWHQPIGRWIKHGEDHPRRRAPDVALAGSPQAALDVPGAVDFHLCESCSVRQCHVQRTGFYALAWGRGCRHCETAHCVLSDLGAGGIKIHGAELDEHPIYRTGHIQILDNRIEDIGRIFHQGIGIFLGHAFDCRVAHNAVVRTAYTGISCGWSWGYRETISRNNLIEWNLIHDIGQGVLSDMGGIYTLGVQPGTVLRGNHIFRVHSHAYGGWGIYPDEGSSHILIEHNLVHDTQGSPFRIHYARGLVVRHNIFASSEIEGLVGIGRVESHCSAFLSHNILLGPAPWLYEGGYAGDLSRGPFATDTNLIWFAKAKVPDSASRPKGDGTEPHSLPWSAWQKMGLDRNSLVADPGLRPSADGRFRWPKNSPALKLGFQPVDWTVCGPRKLGRKAGS